MAVIVKKVVEQFRPMGANMSARPCWTKPDATAVTVSYDTRSGPDMAATFCRIWASSGPWVPIRFLPDIAGDEPDPGQMWLPDTGQMLLPDPGKMWLPDVARCGPVPARGCKYDVSQTLPDVSQIRARCGCRIWARSGLPVPPQMWLAGSGPDPGHIRPT